MRKSPTRTAAEIAAAKRERFIRGLARRSRVPKRVKVPRLAVAPSLRNRNLSLEDSLLVRDRFLDLAKECGLDVSARLLNWYVEKGYFAPLANTVDGPVFSRFQLYWLYELEDDRRRVLGVEAYWSVEEQDRRSWIKNIELNSGRAGADQRFSKWLALVILLQNKFLPAARGHRNWELSHIDASTRTREARYLRQKYLPRVAGDRPLREIGLTLEEAQALRRDMAFQFQRLDPLADWHPLIRLASNEVREKLQGTARLAQEMYVGDRVLENYLWTLTGEPQQDAEDVRFGPGNDRRRAFYGRPKDYRDPIFLDMVLSEFGLHPARSAAIFVEGKTEMVLYPGIAALFGYDLRFLGVEFHDLTGVSNARPKTELLRFISRPTESGPVRVADGTEHIMLAHRPTLAYLWIDRENSAGKQNVIEKFKEARPPAFLKLWEPDLERANFSASELAAGLTALAGRKVTASAIQRWIEGHGSLEDWMWRKYRQRISKPALVPHYLKILERDMRRARRQRADPSRPILQLVWQMIQVVAGGVPFDDPALDGKVLLARA